jgi:hypothetical protein
MPSSYQCENGNGHLGLRLPLSYAPLGPISSALRRRRASGCGTKPGSWRSTPITDATTEKETSAEVKADAVGSHTDTIQRPHARYRSRREQGRGATARHVGLPDQEARTRQAHREKDRVTWPRPIRSA